MQCKGCDAHQFHIASLKEELRKKDELIMRLQGALDEVDANKDTLINHLTGMNRIAREAPEKDLHSIPRRNSIQSRLHNLERKESDPSIMSNHRKAYTDRINSLLKPEVEVTDEKVSV